MSADQRVARAAAIRAAERHPLAPLIDEVLELVFDAGAEEVANEAALFLSRLHGADVAHAHVRHAAAKQRAAARSVRQRAVGVDRRARVDRKSTRLNSSHLVISYAV